MTKRDIEIAKKLKSRISSRAKVVDFKVFGSRSTDTADENKQKKLFRI